MNLLLASSSPRRRELITHLHLPFTVYAANTDETPRPHESPQALVARLSRAKAQAVLQAHPHPDALVLAADTIVVIDGDIIGKPTDTADAEAILKRLRGRTHQVFTGLTLLPGDAPHDETAGWSALCQTHVTMRDYSDADLHAYIASGSVYDKAGAYGIQEPHFHPVARITGCYLNVMGLPLCEVIRGLRALHIPVAADEPYAHDCIGPYGEPCQT